MNLSVDLAGMKLATPLMVASGTFGFGEEFSKIEGFDYAAIGAIVLKGSTLQAQEGNPPPRIVETPSGALNSIGLQNYGVDHVVKDLLPRAKQLGPKIIANIAGTTADEYAEVAERFDAAGVDGLEINISCPNVKQGGMEFGRDPDAAAEVVAAVRAVTSGPVIAKLAPLVTDITVIARACIDAGAQVLSLINTLPGMVIDVESRRPLLGANYGGLSGPAIRPVAVRLVHAVYPVAEKAGIPLIGMGGITSATDALEFFLVGATAVAVGTALFWNPHAATEIIAELGNYLETHGAATVQDIVGTVHLK